MFVFLQLQYGEPVIRRAVPLALAILSASNPQLSIIDTLSKLSHDNDAEVSHNSIFAMGVVGAGKLKIKTFKRKRHGLMSRCLATLFFSKSAKVSLIFVIHLYKKSRCRFPILNCTFL